MKNSWGNFDRGLYRWPLTLCFNLYYFSDLFSFMRRLSGTLQKYYGFPLFESLELWGYQWFFYNVASFRLQSAFLVLLRWKSSVFFRVLFQFPAVEKNLLCLQKHMTCRRKRCVCEMKSAENSWYRAIHQANLFSIVLACPYIVQVAVQMYYNEGRSCPISVKSV